MLEVTYLHHSGFFVETEKYCLLFDYFTEGGRYHNIDNTAYQNKTLVVFVSHFHHDHYDTAIFQLQHPDIHYILSNDVRPPANVKNVQLVRSNRTYTFGDMTVTTYTSNDEGVAFLVEVDGKRVYHAGDLNWWHWKGESEKFNKGIAGMYKKEIDKMKGMTLDVAFVPVDPRLEESTLWGLDYLLKTANVKHTFPMHFWEDITIFKAIQQAYPHNNTIETITHKGQIFRYNEGEAE